MDELTEFTVDFVLSAERAWVLVRNVIRMAAPSDLGEWCEL
ncbi:hypothetical protein [Streptomyces sp. NPDC059757]